MLSVGYGSENREKRIREFFTKGEPCTAVLLAAVHFEWTIKRAILKLGISPTKALRDKLEDIYKIRETENGKDYKNIWEEEVSVRFKNSKLGTVLGSLHRIQNDTSKVRGRIIHGNGTVSTKVAKGAMNEYLRAAGKIRLFTKRHGEDLDTRLKTRHMVRTDI